MLELIFLLNRQYKMYFKKFVFVLLLFIFIGCENNQEIHTDNNVDENRGTSSLMVVPSSFINFTYNIFGQAYVGQVVTINIDIIAPDYKDSIILNYKVNVADDLLFDGNQLEVVTINILPDGRYPSQQINVIPKREGRLFLLVSGDLLVGDEIITKVTAIPIDVERNSSD